MFLVICYLLQQHSTSRNQNLYQSGFNQRNKQQEIYVKRFIARKWLIWLGELAKQYPKSVEEAIRKERLEIWGINWSFCPQLEFLHLKEDSKLLLRPFNWLNQAHPNHLGYSPYFKNDYAPPHGIFQARILVWVAISSSRGSSWPRNWTHISCVSCFGRWILYHWATWEIIG